MDLVKRMRQHAEDMRMLRHDSETVKCLALGADEIERLQVRVSLLQEALAEVRDTGGTRRVRLANVTLRTTK